mgnify:CR=1 FL=1
MKMIRTGAGVAVSRTPGPPADHHNIAMSRLRCPKGVLPRGHGLRFEWLDLQW